MNPPIDSTTVLSETSPPCPDPARIAELAARFHAAGTVILGIRAAVKAAARAYVALEVAADELTEEQAAKLLGPLASD